MVKVLIGYDGSGCAVEAIEDLCRAGLPADHVEARVMSVADVWPDLPGPEYAKLYPEAAEEVRRKLGTALAKAQLRSTEGRDRVAGLFPGWQVNAETAADSPYWGLVKKAQEWRADLLVVGSQGRSAVARMVFGSVSHHAVLYADCSVRIGRCGATCSRAADAPARIIVGWDGSPDAALAIRAAGARQWPPGSECRLVTGLDTRLTTLFAVSDTPGNAGQAVIQDEREELARQAQTAADSLRAKGLLVSEPIQRQGDPKRALLDEAEAWQADCIFVGAKGLSRIERVLLGSVSTTVAARATCSVEIVRSRHPA